jgi:hypothetical protein
VICIYEKQKFFYQGDLTCHNQAANSGEVICPSGVGENRQSRHDECDHAIAGVDAADTVAGHRLDDRPIAPKQRRRLLRILGGDLDATCPPSTAARDLKEEGVTGRFPIATHRRSFLSHSVSPLICVREQNAFSILISVRRDCVAEKIGWSVANI